jgi:uncharacterized protein
VTAKRGRQSRPGAIMVGVGRVLRRAGVQHPFQRTLRVDELRVGDAVVPEGRPIEADLVMEATGEAVVVTGTLTTTADCTCRRCLEPFEAPVVAEVREIFEPRPTEGETYPLEGEEIDLEPLVRDALLLDLPLAPLCRPDCAGPGGAPLGPATGEAPGTVGRASETAGDEDAPADGDEAEAPVDPRWAALSQLRLDR